MVELNSSKKVKFSSRSKSVSGEKVDYFAEQNAKRAEKDKKAAKVRKWGLVIWALIVLATVITAVVLVVTKMQRPKLNVPEEGGDSSSSDGNSGMAAVEDLNEQVTEVFAPTYSVDENGNVVVSGDLEAAKAAFEAALANPANKKRINTIYLSQIVFYASISDHQGVIDVAAKVDPEKLNISEKIKFYNLTYLAYAALGDTEHANQYYTLMRAAANNVTGIGDQ